MSRQLEAEIAELRQQLAEERAKLEAAEKYSHEIIDQRDKATCEYLNASAANRFGAACYREKCTELLAAQADNARLLELLEESQELYRLGRKRNEAGAEAITTRIQHAIKHSTTPQDVETVRKALESCINYLHALANDSDDPAPKEHCDQIHATEQALAILEGTNGKAAQ